MLDVTHDHRYFYVINPNTVEIFSKHRDWFKAIRVRDIANLAYAKAKARAMAERSPTRIVIERKR